MRMRKSFHRLYSSVTGMAGPSNYYSYFPLFQRHLSSNSWTKMRSHFLCDILFLLCPLFTISLMYMHQTAALIMSIPLLCALVIFVFHLLENTLVYAPNEPAKARLLCDTPDNYGFEVWETVTLKPSGVLGPAIKGYLLLTGNSSIRSTCPTIYILHGNAGNMGHRLPLCRLLSSVVDCNIFIIDYRGYGRSTGQPCEEGLYADAKAGFEYLLERTDIDSEKVFIFGRSIGGAVAVHLACNWSGVPPRGVIIENSFTSLPEAAVHVFGKSFGTSVRFVLPSWLFSNQYQSYTKLRQFIHAADLSVTRFLFISGSADELIPPKMMEQLTSAYLGSLTSEYRDEIWKPTDFIERGRYGLVSFAGGQHSDTWLCPNWANVIRCFTDRCCNIPSKPTEL